MEMVSDTFSKHNSLAKYISTFEKAPLKHSVALVTGPTSRQ